MEGGSEKIHSNQRIAAIMLQRGQRQNGHRYENREAGSWKPRNSEEGGARHKYDSTTLRHIHLRIRSQPVERGHRCDRTRKVQREGELGCANVK